MDNPLEEYIEAHISQEPDLLRRINRDTNIHLLNGRMCSGHLQGRLLKMLVQICKAKRIVEFGTFSGYSSICMAEGLPPDGILTTIEADDELEDRIRHWLSQSEHGHKVRLLIGDALQISSGFEDSEFDMAFLDADKRQYPQYLAESMRIVRPGGLIIADNTLWDAHVLEKVTRSAQTQGVQIFNNQACTLPDTECVILPLRDGLTLIRKNDLSRPDVV